jgi:hypothetical protein
MAIKLTPRRMLTTLGIIVAIVAGANWYYATHFSFNARFVRSKAALEAYAAQAMASDPAGPLPALPPRLGVFMAFDVERLPHGFLFFCDYGHPMETNGIAYSTAALPQSDGGDMFKPIEGNWYMVWRTK